jgi:hypothetical protein
MVKMYLLDNQTLDNLLKTAETITLRYGNADNKLWQQLRGACLQARIETLGNDDAISIAPAIACNHLWAVGPHCEPSVCEKCGLSAN